MKTVKKILVSLIIILSLILGCAISACTEREAVEYDRKDMTTAGDWNFGLYMITSAPTRLGIPVCYKYDNANIKVCNSSVNAVLIFNRFATVLDIEKYQEYGYYNGYKKASLNECPVEYTGEVLFQWATAEAWYDWTHIENEFEDYVYFIAEIDKKIVGYSVIYIWTDGETGNGKVLADKEVSKMSEETVREKIQSIIDNHKN